MKVIALNSSPRAGGESKTELMLGRLLSGMRTGGADVEEIVLSKKKIRACTGCYACRIGDCIQKDDMTKELFPKWLEADIAIYATPIYMHFMNAQMKTFLDRTFPAVRIGAKLKNDRAVPELKCKLPSAVVLAVCAFPYEREFGVLSSYMNYLFGERGLLIAEICRPACFMLDKKMFANYSQKIDDILDAAEAGGRELVQNGRIDPKTLERVTGPIADRETVLGYINMISDKYSAKLQTNGAA